LAIDRESDIFERMIAADILMQKINALPPEKIEEVIDFVDRLTERGSNGKSAERAALISAYAEVNAGTEFDLDEELERARIDSLHAIDEVSQ
jgi:ADP-dependent phosphofructokinase/glucokinase